ncbi:MAG: response regulator transcription factor [Chloroherpetonaceae bacterium]|nr:response regulator transcription factor [Chloroherpetonaceae bacterium]
MAEPIKILLIEDEAGIVLTLTDRLKSEGFQVDSERDGEKGFQRALKGHYDVCIIDVMLPNKSGFDICRDLRSASIFTPILMLTARGQTIDKVLGLKLGADDYLTKPFDMMELLARLEALLRRNSKPKNAVEVPDIFHIGECIINFKTMEVKKNGETLELSAKEFQLLRYFIENKGKLLSREILLNAVWGYHAMPSTRTVDVHVAWLRQKLEPNPKAPRFILTMHGMGYKFVGE